ncbi:MAG TPA: acyl-homoserine-lactone synthase [Allosphingosinicella sp.]|nr:acyl-homoserine-lactone synthase [Allosphingosinicella sp.]
MIDVVDPESRWRFSQPLMEMYHHRKRVFVDQLGWDLPSAGSWLEVDEFDHDSAVYLLARNEADGAHLGSVRLLPTTGPHMLTSIFSELCPVGAPQGPDCWEISRLVTNPGTVRGATCVRVHRMLARGLVEFARLNGIRRFTLVAEVSRVPALLAIGWAVSPISLAAVVDGETLQALQIEIEHDTVEKLARRCNYERPASAPVFGERCAA